MSRRVVCWLSCALSALLIAPAGAGAFGPTGVGAAPAATQAGGHTNFTVSFSVADAAQDLKDLTIHLPAGLTGNPRAAVTCSQGQFAADACPAGSRVGSTTTDVDATLLIVPVPISAPGDIYVVERQGNEPARLGIVLRPLSGALGKIYLQSPVTLRRGDGGLDSTLTNLPTSASGLPISITSLSLTLDANASGGPFVTLPTACQTNTTRIDATSYAGTSGSGSASFATTGCSGTKPPFTPSLTVAPAQQTADQPGAVTITLGVPGGDTDGVRQSYVSAARVVLPVGTALSPGVAGGLVACPQATFDGSGACPTASRIGSVAFDTPLLGVLPGDVYFGEPTAQNPQRLFVRVDPGGVDVRVAGVVTPDPSTGQLTTSFSGLPPVPFTSFALTFNGGDRAVLTAPPTCGANTATATLTPDARPGSPVTVAAGFQTVGCPAPSFAPTLQAGVSPTTAGSSATLRTTITRPDGQSRLDRFTLHLPPGLAGSLAGVPRCTEAQANAAACPAATRLGSATATSGTGGAPLTIAGTIYLTDAPAGSGALAGLAVVLPARAGPLDLGTLVTRALFRVRGDQGIDVVTGSLPRIVGGVPLAVRQLDLLLDRPGFVRNASSCAPQAITADLVAQDGRTASASAPYAATSCAAQPFSPSLAVALEKVGPRQHTPVTTTISQSAAEAANRSAVVTLPRGVSPEISALARACPQASLAAGTCPASATIGSATAVTPLLPTELSGDVLLVKPASGVLPELAIRLRGALAVDLRATTALTPDGRLRTSFPSLPDVPLTRFTLRFDGGAGGIITTAGGTCALTDRRFDAAFTSQGGRTADAPGTATIPGCPPLAGTGDSGSGTAFGKLVKGKRSSARVVLRGRTLTITAKAGAKAFKRLSATRGTRRAVRRLRRPARTATLKLRLASAPRRSFTVRVALTPSSGRPEVLTVRVKVRAKVKAKPKTQARPKAQAKPKARG